MNHFPNYTPSDFTRVKVDHYYELQFWKQRFNASEEKLREALKEVGPVTVAVDQYLSAQGLNR